MPGLLSNVDPDGLLEFSVVDFGTSYAAREFCLCECAKPPGCLSRSSGKFDLSFSSQVVDCAYVRRLKTSAGASMYWN